MLKGSRLMSGSLGPRTLRNTALCSGEPSVGLIELMRHVATTSSSQATQHQVARKHRQQQHPEAHQADSLQLQSAAHHEKQQTRLEHLNLWHSVDTIKRLGHRLAKLDPLELREPDELRQLTWSHSLIDRCKSRSDIVPTRAFLATEQPLMAANELVEAVWNIYAASGAGLEFAHMSNETEVEWLTSQWERLNETLSLSQLDEQHLAKLLLECETFDHFMAAKHPTIKRYGCEGAESMLVVLDELLRLCSTGAPASSAASAKTELDIAFGRIDNVIIGMPHRGRLNFLACLLDFDPAAIFSKTNGESELDVEKAWMAQGDVLSHLSTNVRYVYGLDKQHIGLSRDSPEPINVTLLPNPSHLEVVAPVTAGAARGRAHNLLHGYSSSPKFVTFNQNMASPRTDTNLDYTQHLATVLPVQVHGDAAVAGQGIIQETLQMANLPGFTVAGSLHLVVNNQLGFTTPASSARSSRHCTDIFKLTEAPIIHVNASNMVGLIRATRLALAYRQKFAKDVVIDLVCYRQHGHNEMDEPSFTQPLMYSRIRNKKSIPQVYADKLGLDAERKLRLVDTFKNKLQLAHKQFDVYKPDNDNYRNFELPTEYHRDHICSWQTGASLDMLRSIALASVDTPANFSVHPNLQRVLVDERRRKFSGLTREQLAGVKIDWPLAEILAFGSLLQQNHSVRIAGQDVARGTFSTRHAVLVDQNTEQPYVPLNNMPGDHQHTSTAQLEVANTILSEEAALAYEFGYSAETCELSIWEAQFGDFFNTAQSVLDTLVTSSETKWLKQSALTLLLPHGLDGAGPEHSSARIERLLQMSSSSVDTIDTEAKVNWSVCYPTLPSQYFHLLRRQVLRPFRKPLVVLSPKIIFRHPDCVSDFAQFGIDKSFEPILDDPTVREPDEVDTIVLCTGKVYFTLNEQKAQHGLDNVALVRIEELCPFPVLSIIQILKRYPNVSSSKIVWFQEEHKNQGAFSFVDARLSNMAGIKMQYIGRSESETPATGTLSTHKKEKELLMKQFQALSTLNQTVGENPNCCA